MRSGNDEISRISERARQVSPKVHEAPLKYVKRHGTRRLPSHRPFASSFFLTPAYSGPSIISPPPPSQGSMNGYGPQVNSANGQTTVNFVSFDLPNSKPWLRLVSVSRDRRPPLIFHRCIDRFTHEIKGSNYNTIIELFLFLLFPDRELGEFGFSPRSNNFISCLRMILFVW